MVCMLVKVYKARVFSSEGGLKRVEEGEKCS